MSDALDNSSTPLSYAAWRAAIAAGATPVPPSVFKLVTPDVQALEGRRIKFTVTTGNPDRERDVVVSRGVELGPFMRSSVITWAHDYKALPIGRAITVDVQDNSIQMVIEFATADLNPMAEQVFRMVKAGFLKGTSIGFRPLEWSYNEERKGVDFQRVELLEVAIVPIPANAECLIAASVAGIDTAVLKQWAEETLDAFPDLDDATLDTVKGVSPKDVSTVKADEATAWSAPTLGDFTDKTWGDLTAGERRQIAGHAAWTAQMPPSTFGDVKLWHHEPKAGKVVWRGVVAAIARLNQADIPSADDGAVKGHLRRHYRQFRPDDEVPDAIKASLAPPYDRDEIGWKAYLKARDRARKKTGVELADSQLADLFEDYGFDVEATVLRGSTTKQGDAEEAAELVQYQALDTMLGQLASLVTAGQALVSALIADETETPTETSEAEAAEEALEASRLSALLALCTQMYGAIAGVAQLAEALLDEDDEELPSMAPTVMAASLVTKRGRTLSKVNEQKIRTARTHVHEARRLMEAVLRTIKQDQDDEDVTPDGGDDGEQLSVADDEIVLRFADVEEAPPLAVAEDVIEIDAKDLGHVIRDVLASQVQRETRAAVNALRGRID